MQAVSETFIKKNIELSLELDQYLVDHPNLYLRIPNGATLVITLKSDKDFTAQSLSIVQKSKAKEMLIEAQKSGHRWTLQPLQTIAN